MRGAGRQSCGLRGGQGGLRALVTPLCPPRPQAVPQGCGGCSATSPVPVATAVPVTPRAERAPAPPACGPHAAWSPAPPATMVPPASSAASATEHRATPRPEPASAPRRELGPGARWGRRQQTPRADVRIQGDSDRVPSGAGWRGQGPRLSRTTRWLRDLELVSCLSPPARPAVKTPRACVYVNM